MIQRLTNIQELIRLYTFHSPIRKGKFRLTDFALSLSPSLSDRIIAKTRDNRKLSIFVKDRSYAYVYFLGEYENAITSVLSDIIEIGDVCLDVGANIGWYTTLFQKLVGPKGSVYSFEPVPPIFAELGENVRLNSPPDNVTLNNVALGDIETTVDLHIFPDLPDGHASIATYNKTDFQVFPSRMITLDSYLNERKIDNVRLVKIDIEGAELMMLRGASQLFAQKQLPIFEVEMALATTRAFNYFPNDLIEYIAKRGSYVFFAIDEVNNRLLPINGFKKDDPGANVLCIPEDFDLKKLSRWLR